MNSVIHFEIPVSDLDRAKKFYERAFGWTLEDIPKMNYTSVMTTEIDAENKMPKMPGAINGGMTKRNDVLKTPSFAIHVTDIGEAIEKLKTAGGEVIKEKMPVGTMGFVAYFKDTEGNVLSLWQMAK